MAVRSAEYANFLVILFGVAGELELDLELGRKHIIFWASLEWQ